MNKVMLIGNLGADPELRYTPSGKPVCNFRIATDNRFTGNPEWHRIIVWGKVAEACGEYLSKGRQVFVEGRLQTRVWDDRDGNKRYTTEIVANHVEFLGGGRKQAAQTEQQVEDTPTAELEEPSVNDEAKALVGEVPF